VFVFFQVFGVKGRGAIFLGRFLVFFLGGLLGGVVFFRCGGGFWSFFHRFR